MTPALSDWVTETAKRPSWIGRARRGNGEFYIASACAESIDDLHGIDTPMMDSVGMTM